MEEIRLQKYIAEQGVASRRAAEELIAKGCVCVNGNKVTVAGVKVNPEIDVVTVNGKVLLKPSRKYYILLNKPSGYLTTTSDDFGRKTVMELVKDITERIYPVGRLDIDTEGLLIMTNDGEFTNKVIHPRNKINKVYIAQVNGFPPLDVIKQLAKGVDLGDFVTAPAVVELVEGNAKFSKLKIEIHEGRNRQIKRMCEKVGYPVEGLKRVQIGNVMLGNIPLGKWRHMRKDEIDRLLKGGR